VNRSINEAAITSIAESIVGHGCSGRVAWQLRMFKAHFGVSPFIATCLWNHMVDERTLPVMEARPTHLLWALMFIKLYSTEAAMSRICGTTAKTFRQRVWDMLRSIATLDLVRFAISRSVSQSHVFLLKLHFSFFHHTDHLG